MYDTTELLMGLVRSNDIETIERAILAGADVNASMSNGFTLLMAAVRSDHQEMINLLLQKGAHVNEKIDTGDTALTLSAEQGNFFAVKTLIQHIAHINAATAQGNTALFFAACREHTNVVKLLLQNGADPNLQTSNGATALIAAIDKGNYHLAEILLGNKADPNLTGFSFTPLGYCALKGNHGIANLLLKHNADPNAKTPTTEVPLLIAASFGHTDIVNLLLAHNADVDQKSSNGSTALDAAKHYHFNEIVQLLQIHSSNLLLTKQETPIQPKEKQPLKPSEQNETEKVVLGKITPKKMTAEDIAKEAEPHTVPQIPLQPLLSKLNNLTGLSQIKSDVTQLVNFLRVQKLRKDKGLSVPEQSQHMVFTGNPGTGKTTIARLIAQIYKSMGLLSKGQFIETDRAGLVGGYLGQTAIKTQDVVESALGGVLFIDEAYSLTDSIHGHDMYGQEAVATLLKLMEDHRDDLIVIVAGYTEPMQKFIRSNPGLQSRFNKFLHFDDYAPAELTEIFGYFAAQGDYKLHPATELKLHNVFADLYARRDETFGNARLARNLFEKAINAHANRMVLAGMLDEVSLVTLYPEDVPSA